MMLDMEETGGTTRNVAVEQVRAIVVDDHETMRLRIREILEDFGVLVVAEISNGDLVLDAARRLQPHLITVDIRMPGLNGLAATQLLKRQCPQTRVVVITNYPNPHYRRASENVGADAFVAKPDAYEGLLQAIRTWFGDPPHRSHAAA